MFPLKLIIADDHCMFRQGLISLMKTRPDLVQVVGEAATGKEAVELVEQLRPDVVLMDVYMPEGNGLQAAQAIRRFAPEVAIVMLTSSEMDEHIHQAMQTGAAGYLLKTLNANELFELLMCVERGEISLTRAMARRLLKNVNRQPPNTGENVDALTEREIEVLQRVARGASNAQISDELCITIHTVKTHIKNILSKLQLENRTQVAAYAINVGITTVEK